MLAQPIYICALDPLPSPLPTPSRPLIPAPGILHAPLPIDPRQENALDGRYQSQRDRNTGPQPVELPPQSERGAHADRHRHRVVAKQLHVPAHLLPPQAAQDAIAARGQRVEQLERGAQRQYLGHQRGDVGVAGEELGDVVAQAREEDDVEHAHGDGREARHPRADFRGVGQRRADQVCDPRRGGDGDGEGDFWAGVPESAVLLQGKV